LDPPPERAEASLLIRRMQRCLSICLRECGVSPCWVWARSFFWPSGLLEQTSSRSWLLVNGTLASSPVPARHPDDALQEQAWETPGTGVITQDLLPQIPAPGDTSATAFAAAAAGRLGNVGLYVADFSNSDTMAEADVRIVSDEFRNRTRFTQEAFSNVVIDGGMLRISQGQRIPNSYIDYMYSLDAAGQVFCSSGVLRTDATGTQVSFDAHTVYGPDNPDGCGNDGPSQQFVDLHATFNPATWTVTIPTSLQTFDLGALAPGDSMKLDYEFNFTLRHGPQNGQASELSAEFCDPFHLSGNPALGTISLEPPVSTPPEPGFFVLCAFGLAWIGAIRFASHWRRSAAARHLGVLGLCAVASITAKLAQADVVETSEVSQKVGGVTIQSGSAQTQGTSSITNDIRGDSKGWRHFRDGCGISLHRQVWRRRFGSSGLLQRGFRDIRRRDHR